MCSTGGNIINKLWESLCGSTYITYIPLLPNTLAVVKQFLYKLIINRFTQTVHSYN